MGRLILFSCLYDKHEATASGKSFLLVCLMWRKVKNDRWWLFLHFFYLLYRWHIILGGIWWAVRRFLFLVSCEQSQSLQAAAGSFIMITIQTCLLILPYQQHSKIRRFPKTVFSFKFNTFNMQAKWKTNTKCQTPCLSVHMQYCYCMCWLHRLGFVHALLSKVHL